MVLKVPIYFEIKGSVYQPDQLSERLQVLLEEALKSTALKVTKRNLKILKEDGIGDISDIRKIEKQALLDRMRGAGSYLK